MKLFIFFLKTIAVVFVVLVLGVIGLHYSVRLYAEWGAKPFSRLLFEAESVIADVGGCAVLTSEMNWVLTYDKSLYGDLFEKDLLANAPAISKVKKKLSQNRNGPDARLWVVKEPYPIYKGYMEKGMSNIENLHSIKMAEHLVIRFGTHSSYAWLLIFATDNTLKEIPNGVVHIGGTVYLSPRNL